MRKIDVAPALRAIEPLLTSTPKTSNARGNLKTRLRAMFLFHEAAAQNALFVGTGDFDEGFVGYYMKGSGADLAPIASLHKSEVRALLELALHRLVPARWVDVICAAPFRIVPGIY